MPVRRLVIHPDDLGASHSANLAFVELWDLGVIPAGSVKIGRYGFRDAMRSR
ncbi:MAG: hypothetical protein ABIY37_10145 [Devosia sp.]